jgi:aspartate/methionine/tyrosine aminotransferase
VSTSSPHHIDPLWPFRLKPIKAARVSEISEATAASETPPEERVNFHIGNPVQDERLRSAYLRMVLGIDIGRDDLGEDATDQLLAELAWEPEDRSTIEFLRALITKSGPYTPRGGFTRNNPHRIAQELSKWLQQQETLTYDLGQVTGKREIILASGGIAETVRVLLHALSANLVERSAHFFFLNADVQVDEDLFQGIRFERLPSGEQDALERLDEHFAAVREKPTFLFIGCVLQEETRRALRQMSIEAPLMFIEANDEPNHRSLAREAKLVYRVIRMMTPGIFSPKLRDLSTVFLLGNAGILGVVESMHFQLKGTPSASELELLGYLLDHREAWEGGTAAPIAFTADRQGEQFVARSNVGISLAEHAARVERLVEHVSENRVERFVGRTLNFGGKIESAVQRLQRRANAPGVESFAHTDVRTLVADLAANVESASWRAALHDDLLQVFVRNHPEYLLSACVVVSGSSRTALGLLGFHCGIREVIIPDLSWSYEHCFPVVEAVPLASDYTLDADAILAVVRKKLAADPLWYRYGAVAVNNPHNATGRVFDERDVSRLLVGLLEMDVFVIDDLSYQDVAPVEGLPNIKTLRQLAEVLVRTGRLTQHQAEKVVTVHSVSKTDCLAGARLAVVEIRHPDLRRAFLRVQERIQPNIAAMLLTYLFYRNRPEVPRVYWRLRNRIFLERSEALLQACSQLPKGRNTFDIRILPPTGSMYPLMVIDRLPSGLSLDWLASGLARQGIGILPLSTFARTEEGFETGRKTFRLTLGGTDGAETLQLKTRRVLIDLNRLVEQEAFRYNRHYALLTTVPVRLQEAPDSTRWEAAMDAVRREYARMGHHVPRQFQSAIPDARSVQEYVRIRLETLHQRYRDRLVLAEYTVAAAETDGGRSLAGRLQREFFKDSLAQRQAAFQQRQYDRTVHPTQMYSIRVEQSADKIIARIMRGEAAGTHAVTALAKALHAEFLGLNVAISSSEESDELLLDLDAIIAAEHFQRLAAGDDTRQLVSFWGDWDGSNRPSGQGHRLVATTLMANVTRMAHVLSLVVRSADPSGVDGSLIDELRLLPEKNRRFSFLLHDITQLTHQLEKRYRGILPVFVKPGTVRSLGMKLGIARDPLTLLWRHNDRLERKMFHLRTQRRQSLVYYFALNKRLRKQLHGLIPVIQQQRHETRLLVEAGLFGDLLQRMVITPRIHQNIITAQDSFAIDTTVHNIYEINEVSGRHGNPGMILTLQVSMSTKAEALIALDRKMRARHEQTLREHPDLELPIVRLVPLFEDLDAIESIPAYLQQIWDYAFQSRRLNQETGDRFVEIIAEVFIAGSDISQQVGQAAGAVLYRRAKHKTIVWLAEHRLVDQVRLKMGSGEPMQRQGGYYAPMSGKPAFQRETLKSLPGSLPAAARKSAQYATTPVMGVFAGADLRTLQGTISEQLRSLPVDERVQVLYHLREAQRHHRSDLSGAAEALVESRMKQRNRGSQQLERLTIGNGDSVYDKFIGMLTEDFRQILYGREEDALGIHIISYFIARSMPQLRDRPTVRPTRGNAGERGQEILGEVARMIPLSRRGSLLRAIAHNQSQTMVLGINQLTTGLFRALQRFSGVEFTEGHAGTLIVDRILPQLPVYEILQSLRLYHDPELHWLKEVEAVFPAGNSAFLALREDNDSMPHYVGLLQQELLRRHGMDVNDFFDDGKLLPDLLPHLRPDLAILLQANLFNTDLEQMLEGVRTSFSKTWRSSVTEEIEIPVQIRSWRSSIWTVLKQPIVDRVRSFAELAVALHSLSPADIAGVATGRPSKLKVSDELSHFFRSANQNDELRDFLASTLRYLTALSEGMLEVPVSIIRSIKEVERIAMIEEQEVSPEKQDLLRYYLLQIARVAGENG